MKLSELLGVDERAARNLATAYEGYAQIRVRKRSKGPKPKEGDYRFPFNLRAGYLSRAASYWLLIEPSNARRCYQMAAASLHDFLSTIPSITTKSATAELNALAARAFELAALAGDFERTSLPSRLLEITLPNNANPNVFAVIVSAGVAITGKNPEALPIILMGQTREMLARYSGIHVGSLGLPLRLYTELLDIVSQPKSGNTSDLISWIQHVSDRLADRISATQADRFHWKHLYSPTIPFQTDILGLFVGCENFARHQVQRIEWETSSRETNAATLAYLEAAKALIESELSRDQRPID